MSKVSQTSTNPPHPGCGNKAERLLEEKESVVGEFIAEAGLDCHRWSLIIEVSGFISGKLF
jgi:hypothetical protein